MAINPGRAEQVVRETTTGPGTTVRDGSILADSLLISVWIPSVTSGNLTVTVYNLTDFGDEVELMTFPTISGPTTDIYLRKLKLSSSNYRVRAVYTGTCTYEIQAKAITGSGETTVTLTGNTSWVVGQATIGSTVQLLIPAALNERKGIIIKNYSTGGQVVFVGESTTSATPAKGWPIPPNESFAVDLTSGAEIYIVSTATGADIRYAQAGG
jgi:hypothetical protein